MAEEEVTTVTRSRKTSIERVVIVLTAEGQKSGISVQHRTVTMVEGEPPTETVSDPIPIALVQGKEDQDQLSAILGKATTEMGVLLDLRDAEIVVLRQDLQAARELALQSLGAAGADRLRAITEAVAAEDAKA